LTGICRNDVVGFIAFKLDHRHAEGVGGVPHQRKLWDQVFRRFITVGLVVGIHVVAKTVRALVEHHDQLLARPILGELEQHVAKAEDGADRRADLVGQRRQSEECAKNIARTIDQ